MTEINISTRIPKQLEKALENYMKVEHLEKSAAVRKLLFESLQEWREEYALELLAKGKVTVSKGAEIAGMNIWEFISRIKESKIQWVKDEDIEKDLAPFRKK
jgi:predicted HTH domain antitoxin